MILDDDLTEEDLAKLAKDGTDEEKRAVARHPNASLQTLLELAQVGFSEEVDQNPLLPLYVETGSDHALQILKIIAIVTTRSERLEDLAFCSWNDVRCGVATNVNSPHNTLLSLIHDEDYYVRGGVAQNDSTPPTTLALLAHDQSMYVRSRVAENINTPSATLTLLAKDKDDNVRQSVAWNSKTPMETLEMIAKDKNETLRKSVAMNKNLPQATLLRLAKDKNDDVRRAAKRTLAKISQKT